MISAANCWRDCLKFLGSQSLYCMLAVSFSAAMILRSNSSGVSCSISLLRIELSGSSGAGWPVLWSDMANSWKVGAGRTGGGGRGPSEEFLSWIASARNQGHGSGLDVRINGQNN